MVERLIRTPPAEGRLTPEPLLVRLREIDPLAELVYAGNRKWWLGVVRGPNEERKRFRDEMLALEQRRENPNPRNVLRAHLAGEGFAMIACYIGDDPEGLVRVEGDDSLTPTTIVRDFQERDFAFRQYDNGEAAFRERLAETDGTARQQMTDRQRWEWMMNDGREAYSRVMRDRKMFGKVVTGGVEGASRDLLTRGAP